MIKNTSTINKMLKEDLETTIYNLKQDGANADIKISLYRISDGLEANIDGDKPGWAASIIKVPVMIETIRQIEKNKLPFKEKLRIDHKFTLEPDDYISRQPNGTLVPITELMFYMIRVSDNEATNMLADRIGVDKINQTMWKLGMKNSMLGHLLCKNVPRYTTSFNPDGSNITSANDMVKIMRHIYDEKYSKLSPLVRGMAQTIMRTTSPAYIRGGIYDRNDIVHAKEGHICDDYDGNDRHEIIAVNNDLLLCVMINKIKHPSRFDKIIFDELSYTVGKHINSKY